MMRNFIIFMTLFIYWTSLWGQTNTNQVQDETTLNNQLLENSAKAQKILEATGGNKPTSINILSNGGSSSTSNSKNLTDQDKQLSERYVNQRLANKIYQEKCVGEMAQACSGSEVDHKVGGIDPGLVKAVSTAYATFGAMSGSILPLSKGPGRSEDKSKDQADSAGKDKEAKDKEATDFCKYIPTMTETSAAMLQKNSIADMDNGAETSQKEALMKAAKSHDERSSNAQIQAVGWYGGAACYAIRAFAMNTVKADMNLWIKLGAASLLGTFYQDEVKTNKEYADKTREIARSLPGLGDCNPITQNACYCSQPETKNDPQYCKTQIAAQNPTQPNRIACTNSNMQLDPNCNCEKSNTCMDKYIENVGTAELNLGSGLINSPFKSIASLAHGRLEAGILNGSAAAGLAAISKKAIAEMASKFSDSAVLTPAQKAQADAIASKGIPANIARLMAKNPPPQSEIDKASAKFQGLGGAGSQVAAYAPGKSNVLDFSGGNGLGTAGKKVDKKSGMEDLLGKFNPKSGATNNNGKIIEFAQKAQASASQITNTDRPIFEIISLRYQISGRKLLQVDTSN